MAALVLVFGACVEDGSAGDADGEGGEDAYADELVRFDPAEGTDFGHSQLPGVVLGPPSGLYDVASLGCGGEIVLRWDEPGIVDGPGPDLIVFENAFGPEFPEPGEVAVSEDGVTWFTFPCNPVLLEGCAGVTPTAAYPGEGLDPRDPTEAGGDSFDLADLAGLAGLAGLEGGLERVYFVKVTDRSSEYWATQDMGPWCDPGQGGSGGFDLDAIAAVHPGL